MSYRVRVGKIPMDYLWRSGLDREQILAILARLHELGDHPEQLVNQVVPFANVFSHVISFPEDQPPFHRYIFTFRIRRNDDQQLLEVIGNVDYSPPDSASPN